MFFYAVNHKTILKKIIKALSGVDSVVEHLPNMQEVPIWSAE